MVPADDESTTNDTQETADSLALDRRSYLKLTGTAAASAATVGAATGSAAAADSGYGAQGFGEGEYGGGSTNDSSSNGPPAWSGFW